MYDLFGKANKCIANYPPHLLNFVNSLFACALKNDSENFLTVAKVLNILEFSADYRKMPICQEWFELLVGGLYRAFFRGFRGVRLLPSSGATTMHTHR